MNRPEPYTFENIAPPPVEPATRERVTQATTDVAAVGLEAVARSGEAVVAGCDLCGMVVEGVIGLIGGLLG